MTKKKKWVGTPAQEEVLKQQEEIIKENKAETREEMTAKKKEIPEGQMSERRWAPIVQHDCGWWLDGKLLNDNEPLEMEPMEGTRPIKVWFSIDRRFGGTPSPADSRFIDARVSIVQGGFGFSRTVMKIDTFRRRPK